MLKFWKVQQQLAMLLLSATSSGNDVSSESSELSESCSIGEEISSLASSYSSSESSSGGGQRSYRRGVRDAERYYEGDYRQIPRRRRRY